MTGTEPTDRAGELVEVALPLPVPQTFTYGLRGASPAPGTRVVVPFGRKERIGWVVGVGRAGEHRIRDVLSVLDARPSITPDVLRLCRWAADYYLSPLGMVLRAALPSLLSDVSRDVVRPAADPPESDGDLSERQRALVAELSDGERTVASLRRSLGWSPWEEVRRLVELGWLEHETVPPRRAKPRTRRVVKLTRWISGLAAREDLFGRAQRQREAYEALERAGGSLALTELRDMKFSRSVVSGLQERGVVEVVDEEWIRDPFREPPPEAATHPLTPDQVRAVERVEEMAGADPPLPVLLRGVTGSGKTRVYIEVLQRVLDRGGSAIVLVPEIALTPQTVSRFRSRFDEEVAVLHSGLSDGERFDAWRQLRDGRRRIAVGARSALFAPVSNLGLIVVDEEHDGSYKQSETPRYHARDLAVVRARQAGALCVLGSATPSLESWSNAAAGKFALAELPERVGGGRLPPVRVVDLRRKGRGTGGAAESSRGAPAVLSAELVEGVHARLERSEQVILLLNRRGYSSFVQCRECGEVDACPRCSVSLTFHRGRKRLLCHHCRHEEPVPRRCLRCGSDDLSFRGLGTEQVERVVTETFAGARVARMDVDTTSRKWAHHEILERVGRGEVDILLGTQMIAKGLDFPRVTLVGVVNADVGIHLPDFRASERTFQLLSQVAGRAGRGALGGEVIVQTSLPQHHSIENATRHDYAGFAARELEARREPGYPPFVRMANVVLSSPLTEQAADAATDAVEWIRVRPDLARGVHLVGPAPCPIERLHGRWRFHFLLRSRTAGPLGRLGAAFLADFRPRGSDVRVIFDRDPTALL